MLTVMATQDSVPSVQSRSTTPTGEESTTPVSQPSSLGELSASMVHETNRKLEAIQRAQVSSLMGADKTKEPQDKTPRKLSPTLATRPKKYALEMWVEIETNVGMYTTPEDDSYSIDFAIDAINRAYPGCTRRAWAVTVLVCTTTTFSLKRRLCQIDDLWPNNICFIEDNDLIVLSSYYNERICSVRTNDGKIVWDQERQIVNGNAWKPHGLVYLHHQGLLLVGDQ